MAREWTDEQDALAYDTFVTLAGAKGTEKAADVMRGIMRMGAVFTEIDVDAWISRYVDEDEGSKVGDTYTAANGHRMKVTEVRWSEADQQYVPVQWNAAHADDCRCSGEGSEDW